jgi:fatty-acyl-CoA synthase
MATPARHFDPVLDEERLLDVVRALIFELGHRSALASVRPNATLERELGLGSLERVELLLRIEQAFGTRLEDSVLAEADTVQDVMDALAAAHGDSAMPGVSPVSAPLEPKLAPGGIAEGLPSAETFQEVLRHRGHADATRTHLIFYDGENETSALTFGELLSGAERVAADLAKRGIGRGDAVAIMLPTSPDFFHIFSGVLLAGATPVPIYPPFRADRIEEYASRQSAILANAGARLLVTFHEAGRVAKLLKPRVASLEGVVTATSLLESRVATPLGPQLHSHGEDLALLQYTSGSTGNPKGVMLTHGNLLANVRSIGAALGLRSDDTGVSWLPLYHDMGLIGAWLMPLYFGLPVVILSPLAFLSRPIRWLRALHHYHGTVSAAPNFAYELAAAKITDAEMEGLDLSAWRSALNGAEPVLPATLNRFAERFARCGFLRPALLPVYGLAEASLAVTIPPPGVGPRVDHVDRATFEAEGRAVASAAEAALDDPNVISFVSVGPPIPQMEVRIVDDSGRKVEDRVEGQLWFRGPSVTRGYFRNEEATAALFPAGAEEGWVNSGDRAYQAEGDFYITGRVKDIIIHAGHNLYPHEIEDVVAQVPGVRKGCVVAFGATNPATGTERLVVVAESREREAAERGRIAQAITAQVAAAIGSPPDVVEVVPPNTIPKTSSGKLQRDATKNKFLAGSLAHGRRPVWWQVARLALASSGGRIRSALRRTIEISYGCHALVLLGLCMIPAWLLVLIIPSRKAAGRITATAARLYFGLAGCGIQVSGRENLRDGRTCLMVSNHTSYADVLVLIAAIGTNYHFVAKDEVRHMPFVRTFVRKLGHFAFKREDPHARLEQAHEIEEVLRRGESVFVFPEGTFSAQAGVRPFQLGSFKAAIAAGQPILPMSLNGVRRLLRDGTLLPRRSQITLTISPPIEHIGDPSDWHEIVRVRDAARETISRYSGEALL